MRAIATVLIAALTVGSPSDSVPDPPKPAELATGHYAVRGEASDGARWNITVTVRPADGCQMVAWSNGQMGIGRADGNTVWIGGPFGLMELTPAGKQWRGRYWTGQLTGAETWTRLVEAK